MLTAAILSASQLAFNSFNSHPPEMADVKRLFNIWFNNILPNPYLLCFFKIATIGTFAILSFVRFAKQNPTGCFLYNKTFVIPGKNWPYIFSVIFSKISFEPLKEANLLSNKTSDELSTATGKELAKEEIKEMVNTVFNGQREVLRVSFGQFIIQ